MSGVEDRFNGIECVSGERFDRAYGFYRTYLRSVIYRDLDCGILRYGAHFSDWNL